MLFCLKSTYKKVGQDELHHTQEDQSEHINKFDEGDPLHEGILYPDVMFIAHSWTLFKKKAAVLLCTDIAA